MVGLDAELGTLEPGKWADLVIVNGDPYDLATLGERIVRVYRGGVVAHRNDADDR
jgi:imidazolonepropionase-like amidohydrolase